MFKVLTSIFIFTMLSHAKSNTETIKIGKEIFAKCAVCHGADGRKKALGKSEIIGGRPAEEIERKVKEYKAGTGSLYGKIMKGNVISLSDYDIRNVAEYISSLDKQSEAAIRMEREKIATRIERTEKIEKAKKASRIKRVKKTIGKMINSDKIEYKHLFINPDDAVCGYIRAMNRDTGLFSNYKKFVSYPIDGEEIVSAEDRYGKSPMFDDMWYKACGKYLN